MVLVIIIAFISLIGLLVLHEFGHFILAKRFGVKVEEFGIGYPPRIIGKKIGETLYSLNLLPFGAFVRIHGEEEDAKDPRSFTSKPIWQRALILIGGVLTFWIISFLILSFIPTGVGIIAVQDGSPADLSGLITGDVMEEIIIDGVGYPLFTIKDVQLRINENRGEEITLVVQRGEERVSILARPRLSPPPQEGALGIALGYAASQRNYPLYQAPYRGFLRTAEFTFSAMEGWYLALSNITQGKPSGARLMGPIGIFDMFTQVAELGSSYFLLFLALISIYIALFNILPIPVVDGGRLLFLGIEALRGKPFDRKIEQNVNALFFFILIALMIWVTIQDVIHIF